MTVHKPIVCPWVLLCEVDVDCTYSISSAFFIIDFYSVYVYCCSLVVIDTMYCTQILHWIRQVWLCIFIHSRYWVRLFHMCKALKHLQPDSLNLFIVFVVEQPERILKRSQYWSRFMDLGSAVFPKDIFVTFHQREAWLLFVLLNHVNCLCVFTELLPYGRLPEATRSLFVFLYIFDRMWQRVATWRSVVICGGIEIRLDM